MISKPCFFFFLILDTCFKFPAHKHKIMFKFKMIDKTNLAEAQKLETTHIFICNYVKSQAMPNRTRKIYCYMSLCNSYLYIKLNLNS